MARRRDERVLIEIDTGPDGTGSGFPDDVAPPEPDPARPSWFTTRVAEPVRRRWRAVPRRLRVGVVAGTTAVAVLGAGTAVALDHRADAAHAARMAAAPGGVIDLSAPLAQAWQVETDTGVLAVLDGGLLVTREGTEVLAVDAATGEVAWRHDLGALIECGVSDDWGFSMPREPEATVTCLSGTPERTLTVLDATGEVVGERSLGAVGTATAYSDEPREVAMILADGAIAVGDSFYRDLGTTEADDAVAEVSALLAAGTLPHPALRVEDALTGEVRGEVELVLATDEEIAACFEGVEGDLGLTASPYPEPEGWGVNLSYCADAWIGSDGTVAEAAVWDRPRPLAGGGQVTSTETGSTIVTPDGREVEIPGFPLDFLAVESADGPHLAVLAEGGLGAFGPDGELLWSTEGDVSLGWGLLAAGGMFVAQVDGAVVGIDAATGAQRWSRDDLLGQDGYDVWGMSVATDGETGLIWTTAGDPPASRAVAFDLDDGTARWELDLGDAQDGLTMVGGHVVATDLGGGFAQRQRDGVLVEEAHASLRGYAVP